MKKIMLCTTLLFLSAFQTLFSSLDPRPEMTEDEIAEAHQQFLNCKKWAEKQCASGKFEGDDLEKMRREAAVTFERWLINPDIYLKICNRKCEKAGVPKMNEGEYIRCFAKTEEANCLLIPEIPIIWIFAHKSNYKGRFKKNPGNYFGGVWANILKKPSRKNYQKLLQRVPKEWLS